MHAKLLKDGLSDSFQLCLWQDLDNPIEDLLFLVEGFGRRLRGWLLIFAFLFRISSTYILFLLLFLRIIVVVGLLIVFLIITPILTGREACQ